MTARDPDDYRRYVTELVDAAPPLTDEQVDRLAGIVRTVRAEAARGDAA